MEALTADEITKYSVIIDKILQQGDLSSISSKQVRIKLTTELGQDLSQKKEAVNKLIGQRFDNISSRIDSAVATNDVVDSVEKPHPPSTKINGTKKSSESSKKKRSASDDEDDMSDVKDEPKAKKPKNHSKIEEDDAAMAARLQDEENRMARPTRGGATRKKPTKKNGVKKSPKKKSSAKVRSDDDSSIKSGAEDDNKERKGGFHKRYNLSEPLAAVVGEHSLSRPQTVKKIWEYIRANELQDQSDKRNIICDNALRAVFKTDKVSMFAMNKSLSSHLYAMDE